MGPWVLPKLNSLVKEHPAGTSVTLRGKVSWKNPGERRSARNLCEVVVLVLCFQKSLQHNGPAQYCKIQQ